MKNKYLIIITLALTSCNSLSEAGKVLRNEKVNTNDEFLVKKKQPLELPPDYNELPMPNSQNSKNEKNNENIKKILKVPEQEKNGKQSISVEKSILERIRK